MRFPRVPTSPRHETVSPLTGRDEVVGQVDRGHAALAEFTLDGVAALKGGIQTGDGIGHGGQNASKACEVARISPQEKSDHNLANRRWAWKCASQTPYPALEIRMT